MNVDNGKITENEMSRFQNTNVKVNEIFVKYCLILNFGAISLKMSINNIADDLHKCDKIIL